MGPLAEWFPIGRFFGGALLIIPVWLVGLGASALGIVLAVILALILKAIKGVAHALGIR